MTGEPRAAFSWALGASLLLHALALLALDLWIAPAAVAPHRMARLLTVELEPLPAPPEILKNTLAPETERPREKSKVPTARIEAREGTPAADKAAKRRPADRVEKLPEEQLGEVMGRLSETLLYPPEALRRGLEGEVVLLLELGEDGRILEATVASSSGHALLDEAAVRAVHRLGSIAASSAGKAILLPVRFRIL